MKKKFLILLFFILALSSKSYASFFPDYTIVKYKKFYESQKFVIEGCKVEYYAEGFSYICKDKKGFQTLIENTSNSNKDYNNFNRYDYANSCNNYFNTGYDFRCQKPRDNKYDYRNYDPKYKNWRDTYSKK